MVKLKSSQCWFKEYFDDYWVVCVQVEGYCLWVSFKLLEIYEKDKLFWFGMMVFDLGVVLGGWFQVVGCLVGLWGIVVVSDIFVMDVIFDVIFVQGDFWEQVVYE